MHLPVAPPGTRPNRWRCHDLRRGDQVFNAPSGTAAPAPVTDTRAELVRVSWLPRLPGQAVPLIGEDMFDACPDR